jgi:general secretion pathway protein D
VGYIRYREKTRSRVPAGTRLEDVGHARICALAGPARALVANRPGLRKRRTGEAEWVTRVITVRKISAAQLVPVLRPLMPQTAHMAASVAGPDGEKLTKLIVVDRYANVRRISQIVDELDR